MRIDVNHSLAFGRASNRRSATLIAHAPQPKPTTHIRTTMAAFTFNPLVLSARAVAPAKATRATRRAAKRALRCSATSEEEDVMGEIGLGDLEDIMAKADGGASVPKFIADLGIEPLTQGFKFLGSDQMTGPGSEMLFVEKFGETLYREAGFTETAEKINGRLAVRTTTLIRPFPPSNVFTASSTRRAALARSPRVGGSRIKLFPRRQKSFQKDEAAPVTMTMTRRHVPLTLPPSTPSRFNSKSASFSPSRTPSTATSSSSSPSTRSSSSSPSPASPAPPSCPPARPRATSPTRSRRPP